MVMVDLLNEPDNYGWNPNSGDTGGLVEDNWNTIVWKKIDYLTTIGLTPWYMQKEKYNENIRH